MTPYKLSTLIVKYSVCALYSISSALISISKHLNGIRIATSQWMIISRKKLNTSIGLVLICVSIQTQAQSFVPALAELDGYYTEAVLQNKFHLPNYIQERKNVCTHTTSSPSASEECLQKLISQARVILACEASLERWEEMVLNDKHDMNETIQTYSEAHLPPFVNDLFLQVTQAGEEWMRKNSKQFPGHMSSRPFAWRLRAFKPPVVNAIASAGGDVIISDLMWTKNSIFNQDDIRAVLAHEVAHVLLNHSLQMGCLALEWNNGEGNIKNSVSVFSEDMFGTFPVGKSRQSLSQRNETIADKYAAHILKYMKRPASDMTNALIKLSSTMPVKGMSSGSHPDFHERIENSKKY